MKTIIFCLFAMALRAAGQVNSAYDATLAAKLGGDEHGMKQYILVILKTGAKNPANTVLSDSLFKGHMQNIEKLAAMKKLVVAGPLRKNDRSYRGIFILDVRSVNEANVLLAGDPSIREKVFDVEMFEWYGSAALPEYLPAHEKIRKKDI